MEDKILINKDEFLNLLLDEISQDRFIKALETQSQEFKAGAYFGLSWAGNLTSLVTQFISKMPSE